MDRQKLKTNKTEDVMNKSNCYFDLTKEEGGALRVRLHGEIDHHSAVQVRTELDSIVYEERPNTLILDLSAIEFMDSSGLGLVMGRYALMQRLGGQLRLCNPHERIAKIFELAGLERMIQIESELKEEKQ